MKKIVITQDLEGNECMYVDGKRVEVGDFVNSSSIARESEGKPIVLVHIVIDLPEDLDWPENLSDLKEATA